MNAQSGFTFIEVLIALIVISTIFLGTANLQLHAVNSNQESFNRMQAIKAAQDMAGRLTNNRPGVFNNAYALIDFSAINCENPPPFICAPLHEHDAQTCDATQMAQFDATDVFCSVEKRLPELTMDIRCEDSDATDAGACSAGSMQHINVAWRRPSWMSDEQTTDGTGECPWTDESQTYRKPCVELRVLP